MQYEIVTLTEKTVEGLLIKTENTDGKAIADIGQLWNEFYAKGKNDLIKNRIEDIALGVYTDYEGDFTQPFSYMAGYAIHSCSDSLLYTKKIEAGTYLKFTAEGDLQETVGRIWQAVWELPVRRAYKSDFEEYILHEGQPPRINIYIGIPDSMPQNL